jgi:hypothetical protein
MVCLSNFVAISEILTAAVGETEGLDVGEFVGYKSRRKCKH